MLRSGPELGAIVKLPRLGELLREIGREGESVFYGGASLFLLGSTLCGFSHTMLQLIAFRALQGLGAGVVPAVSLPS